MEGFRFKNPRSFFFSVVLFLSSVALSNAGIVDFDEHWQRRAKMARAQAKAAYNPHPLSVTTHFKHAVHKALEMNSTRRGLGSADGSCQATNPIDSCWRCDKNWDTNRKKLASCARGFGHKTTGGKDGEIYVVTNPSDNDVVNPKNGTLRYAVIQDKPLWIIFDHNMHITLSQELIINSNKTIDGRGAQVHISNGGQLTIQFASNIIIHNIVIHDLKAQNGGTIRDTLTHCGTRSKSDGDGISIFGSSNIWIDHVSLSNCQDGLIDIVEASTAITVSNCYFTKHNDVMLIGASDKYSGDAIIQVTIAFNHFGSDLVQRMPRCRWGFCHVVNNDYTKWSMYAIGGSKKPTIISQGNRYVAPDNAFAKEVTKRDAIKDEWKSWTWQSDGDVLENGAVFVESGSPYKSDSKTNDFLGAKAGTFVPELTRFAGVLDCQKGVAC